MLFIQLPAEHSISAQLVVFIIDNFTFPLSMSCTKWAIHIPPYKFFTWKLCTFIMLFQISVIPSCWSPPLNHILLYIIRILHLDLAWNRFGLTVLFDQMLESRVGCHPHKPHTTPFPIIITHRLYVASCNTSDYAYKYTLNMFNVFDRFLQYWKHMSISLL